MPTTSVQGPLGVGDTSFRFAETASAVQVLAFPSQEIRGRCDRKVRAASSSAICRRSPCRKWPCVRPAGDNRWAESNPQDRIAWREFRESCGSLVADVCSQTVADPAFAPLQRSPEWPAAIFLCQVLHVDRSGL